MQSLHNTRILLGITGGIAAYKSAELLRLLKKAGADVRVVLTEGGSQFITPLTLAALSGHKVYQHLFDANDEADMSHIGLARWADLILVAPATSNFIAKYANGIADDLLTTLCLATTSPVRLAPAMNVQMWNDASTQDNIRRLLQRNIETIGPDYGEQACGEVGLGRMSNPDYILTSLLKNLPKGPLNGKNVLITAGPTHEAIDPVRFISNHSSGKMGFALAEAALSADATVTLITGPTNLECNSKINRVDIISTQQMFEQVMMEIEKQDIFIGAAAVADYRVKNPSTSKIKKHDELLTLELEKNPDIVASICNLRSKPYTVGFALETENMIENAKQKLADKKLDMIIANSINAFYSDDNTVTILTENDTINIDQQSKHDIATQLITLISGQLRCNVQ